MLELVILLDDRHFTDNLKRILRKLDLCGNAYDTNFTHESDLSVE